MFPEDIEIRTSDIGFSLITTETSESSELFSTLDNALEAKDREAYIKRATGLAIGALGLTAIFGSLAAMGDAVRNNDGREIILGYLGVTSGMGAAYIASIIYKSGDLARRQWKRIKDAIVGSNQAPAEVSEIFP